jgi:hypothetical protein
MFPWRKKSQRVLCYVLVFDQYEIIKKSLDFLTRFADKLELVVVENPSRSSEKIRSLVDSYGQQGKVARSYYFNENITGMAYDVVITHELSRFGRAKYVMVTDGDLTATNDDWLEEELAILGNNPSVFACGASLDMSNLPLEAFPEAASWIPPDIAEFPDFYEAGTGGHLLLFRSKGLYEFMKWKDQNETFFIDGKMQEYCYQVKKMKWARTKRTQAYHLTWDLYKDPTHRYTRLKTSKTFAETWRHHRTATYKFRDYSSSFGNARIQAA